MAVLVNDKNNYYTNNWGRKVLYGEARTFGGYSYHKETVSDQSYWVRDGYTIKYEKNKRYPGAEKDNIIKAYKTNSYTSASDAGLLKSNQIMVESAGVSTLTGVDLDDVSGGTYVGATNSGSTSTPSSFNYMIKDDNGSYIDAGNSNYSTHFAAAAKNSDGTYSYNGEVLSNDNLYVISLTDRYGDTTSKVGVFLTSSGKVYTGKVFGANNEVLMTTKNDDGTLYSYWGADTPDPNSKLADMTIGQFNQALEKVNNNSKAVAGDAIKKVVTTEATDGNGGTISLLRRGTYNAATGKYEGEHYVDGGLTLTSTGGNGGSGKVNDVKIKVSNGTDMLTLDAGTKVEAIGTKDATTSLKINGEDYTISLWTAQADGKDVKAVNQKVNFVGSEHITVTGKDGQITFATTGLADTNFTNITEEGNTYIKKLAKGEDVYIKAGTYTVGNDGSVTMTYVDGNGNPVAGTAKITGIAKSDLSNITNEGNNVINNIAKEAVKVVAGTSTTVTEGLSEDGKTKVYAVNVNTADIQAATDVTGKNGISVTNTVENGVKKYIVSAKLSNNFAIDQDTGNIDLAPSITVGKTNPVTINGNTGEITGLSNKTTTAANFADGSGRAATEEQLKVVSDQAGKAIETAGKGWNLTTNGQNKTNIAPDATVNFASSNDNLVISNVISNAGVDLSFSLSDNLDLTNNKDKKGSVKVGENTALSNELLQVGKDVSLTASALNVGKSSLTTSVLMVGGLTYINSSGLNANSQKITNLAEGDISETSTDAVNGSQLYNTNQAVIANAENINSLSHSLNKLDSRINRVGAGAAALAALHPLDFDPDNKWDFAAGYGNYAGANAVAIGTYYRPNENTMFSIGGSFGGGENMINAGVSFKLGSGGSGITTSKTVMAKKIKEQDELLKAQDAKMKEQDEKIAKLEALVAQQGEMIRQALGKK